MSFSVIWKHFFQISILKTIYFNFKCFDFKTSCRFPVLIHKGTIINTLGDISIIDKLSPGLIVFGRNCKIDFAGKVIFRGRTRVGPESHFYVAPNAILDFGNNFVATSGLKINCFSHITFGHNCLMSWGIQVLDTDFHKIMIDGKIANIDKPISIGNHVWVGFDTRILKGSIVKDYIIIGSNSLLNKIYDEPYAIYAGSPAKLVKRGVTWDY